MLTTRKCKHGTFTFPDNDKWIGGSLRDIGEYSEPEVQYLLGLINEESIVVEVGANIGAITVPLGKKAAKVYAFEPQPEIYDILRTNLVENMCVNVQAEMMGVGSMPGLMKIEPYDYDAEGMNTGEVRLFDKLEGAKDCEVVTLDKYCADFERLDLIKIDVEGMEGAVLRGAQSTLERLKPVLYVENDRKNKSRELIHQIMSKGYRLWWHLPELHNPDPVGDDATFNSVNMLCVHETRQLPADMAGLFPIESPEARAEFAFELLQKARPPRRPAIAQQKGWACVVRLGGVGDNLMASAVLPGLRAKWGKVEVIAAEPQHVVFENNPFVDKLTIKKAGEPPWGDGISWQLYWADRATEYDAFVHLSHSVEILMALAPYQTAYHWPASMRRKLCGASYLEMAADIAEVPYDTLAPAFFPDEIELARARETKQKLGGRYVGWVLSGTRDDKVWSAAGIAVARIIKELGLPVVLFGMPSQRDYDMAKQIMDFVQVANGSVSGLHSAISRSMDAPHWPIRRVLTQVQQSDVVVTPDTGPAWAAAMCDMPKVVLLSHASPENITKYWRNTISLTARQAQVPCWPCHQLHDAPESCQRTQRLAGLSPKPDDKGAACINDISVKTVMGAVAECLGQSRRPLRIAAE